MSITVTYKCDRCGAEQSMPEQMWKVQVSMRHLPGPAYMQTVKKEAEWCRKCCQIFMLLGNTPEPQPLPEPPLTLEDLVRAVCKEEIEAATGAS